MSSIIDTHCHFNHAMLKDDMEGAIDRARSAGVGRMIVVGFDLASSAEAVRLADSKPETLYAAIGIHPHDAHEWSSEAENTLRRLARARGVVALGEIGLDYYRDLSPRDQQATAFRAQRNLAGELGLPIVIHCRDAYEDVLTLLRDETEGTVSGVMHCWAGKPDQAREAVSIGLRLGFGGALTFKKADDIREAAREAEMTDILLETDAPYLAPEPYRGKRNEPAYIGKVAERLAEIRCVSVDEICRVTTENALRQFPRMAPANAAF